MISTLLGAGSGLLIRVWANGLARKRLLQVSNERLRDSLMIDQRGSMTQ